MNCDFLVFKKYCKNSQFPNSFHFDLKLKGLLKYLNYYIKAIMRAGVTFRRVRPRLKEFLFDSGSYKKSFDKSHLVAEFIINETILLKSIRYYI